LLTVKAEAEEEDEDFAGVQCDTIDEGIFSSVHNCVFFATQVLKSQVRQISLSLSPGSIDA
jgi:hypothetical protein